MKYYLELEPSVLSNLRNDLGLEFALPKIDGTHVEIIGSLKSINKAEKKIRQELVAHSVSRQESVTCSSVPGSQRDSKEDDSSHSLPHWTPSYSSLPQESVTSGRLSDHTSTGNGWGAGSRHGGSRVPERQGPSEGRVPGRPGSPVVDTQRTGHRKLGLSKDNKQADNRTDQGAIIHYDQPAATEGSTKYKGARPKHRPPSTVTDIQTESNMTDSGSSDIRDGPPFVVALSTWLWMKTRYTSHLSKVFKMYKLSEARHNDKMIVGFSPLTGENLDQTSKDEIKQELDSLVGTVESKGVVCKEVPLRYSPNMLSTPKQTKDTFITTDGRGGCYVVGTESKLVENLFDYLTNKTVAAVEPQTPEHSVRDMGATSTPTTGSQENLSGDYDNIEAKDSSDRKAYPTYVPGEEEEEVTMDTDTWKYLQKVRPSDLAGMKIMYEFKMTVTEVGDITMISLKGKSSVLQRVNKELMSLAEDVRQMICYEDIDMAKSRSQPEDVVSELEKFKKIYPDFIFEESGNIYHVIGPKSVMHIVKPELLKALGMKRKRALQKGKGEGVDTDTPNPLPNPNLSPTVPSSTRVSGSDRKSYSSAVSGHGTTPVTSHRSAVGMTFKFGYKRYIHIIQGDITKLCTSAIVNAANDRLDNIGGVAAAIATAAGPELDRSCRGLVKQYQNIRIASPVVTPGYRLKATHVIHVVGPQWRMYNDKQQCVRALNASFFNCLKTAEDMRLSSIAIPAVSSGMGTYIYITVINVNNRINI